MSMAWSRRPFGGVIEGFIVFVRGLAEVLAFPALLLVSIYSRFARRPVDIGLGPEPLINNVYHKKALMRYGYSAETFVTSVFFITKEFDRQFIYANRIIRLGLPLFVFCLSIFRYRCLYFYFNGGPLFSTILLWRLEPFLLRLAGVRMIVMPYGSDVHCMDRCPNLLFRQAMAIDYPDHRLRQSRVKQRIDLWTRHADHLIAGCEWVDYLYHWDTLMLGHFSIDTDAWRDDLAGEHYAIGTPARPLRVLHAPNHRAIKGSCYFIQAVHELQLEGVQIELLIAEKLPNGELRDLMRSVDVVADQLVMGWYAMFAIEAMALGKPVLCYIRQDLKRLYVSSGLIEETELPIVECTPASVKESLRHLAMNRQALHDFGSRGRAFVVKHHSLEAVGGVFDKINRLVGISPAANP